MLETIKTKLVSRKFWAAFIGSIAPILCGYLSEEVAMWDAIQASTTVVVAFLFGQSWTDGQLAKG